MRAPRPFVSSLSRAAAFVAATSLSIAAHAGVVEVKLGAGRIHFGDLVKGAPEAAKALDLGAAPAPGGSRLVTQAELKKALDDAKVQTRVALPEAVRVVRRTKKLDARAIDKVARDAIQAAGLPRGATLATVKAPTSFELSEGWDGVTAEIPKPPHRTGSCATVVTLAFKEGSEVVARLSVPIELSLGAEAAAFDVAKGASLQLVVRRGLVEISATALAGSDADVGSTFTVTLRPSGRVVRAKLVDKEHAEAIEGG